MATGIVVEAGRERVFRFLFYLTLAWGVAVIWIAPRPPMIDLPQHAGQVALLRDLIKGESPWSGVVWINLVTPYLIGYGLALPLSFFLSVEAALKCVLTAAYLAFVFLARRMRAYYGADARLDWLMLGPFFGFAYYWGFMTFLTAAPVVILFILAADRYGREASPMRGLAVALCGLALLLSHGLAFAFGAVVAGLVYTLRCRASGAGWPGRWLRGLWAFVIPGAACILYYVINNRIQAHFPPFSYPGVRWNLGPGRLRQILVNSLGSISNARVLPAVVSVVLLAAPWLLGLRLNRRHASAAVLLAVTLLVSVLMPTYMIDTAYIYQRFAIFVLPAYALLFAAAPRGSAPAPAWPVGLMVAGVWSMLAYHSAEAWKFSRESRDFEPVLAAMAPGQRALALALARGSEAAQLSSVYDHYAVWYQAEKHGLVEFSFAWMQPQIVRYRFDRLPAVREGFRAVDFDARKHGLALYRYVLVRHLGPVQPKLFRDAACPPAEVLRSGAWTLFERADCRSAGLAGPAGGAGGRAPH